MLEKLDLPADCGRADVGSFGGPPDRAGFGNGKKVSIRGDLHVVPSVFGGVQFIRT
jgi:hypothetical protein